MLSSHTWSWPAVAIAALGTALSAQAANAPGIGVSGSLTWEQIRFYAPSSGASATYTGGVPTSVLSVASDYCTGTGENCGEPMSFSSLIGGVMTATASDDGNGAQNATNGIVHQDLGPNNGGLGVVSRNDSTGQRTGRDEINFGDRLTLTFANAVKIVGFHFWDKDHGSYDLSNSGLEKFGLSIDGGATQLHSLSNFPWYGGSSTLIGNSFTFSYKNEDYYLGAIKIAAVPAIPEPQTYALMLAGLAAVVFVARRRRQQR
jgi:hypothetical protein